MLLLIIQNHQLQVPSFDNLSSSQKAFTMSIENSTQPRTYKEKCQYDYWWKAMKTKLDSLAKNETWRHVDLPPTLKPIGSKSVYKVKHKGDESIERYKERLATKGYNQEGLDFFPYLITCRKSNYS